MMATITQETMEELHNVQSDVHAEIALDKNIDYDNYQAHDYLTYGFHIEVAEVANQLEFFKFWKSKKKDNKELVLEELADCVALLLAVCEVKGYQKIIKEVQAFPFWEDSEYYDMFILLKRLDLETFQDVSMAFTLVLGIALKAGFTAEQLVQAYFDKSSVNIERQESGY